MKKTKTIFYYGTLGLLIFLNYGIGNALYSAGKIDINEARLVTQLIALINVPLNLILGLVRLWLLKPVNPRSRLLDVSYFALPILLMVACLMEQIWVGIILSVLAGAITVYEFISSIIKTNHPS